MKLRVVKLGGSLLDLAGLAERLRDWLARQPAAATVLVVGGGALAETIRRAQGVHDFDDRAAHRLCLEVMAVTARLVCELTPRASFCSGENQIDREALGRLQICDTRQLVIAANQAGELPESWELTSDSIAAHLARVLEADELVLLKSTLPPGLDSVDDLAGAGTVDRYFPMALRAYWAKTRHRENHAAGVRLVNLRDARFAETVIPESPLPSAAQTVG